MSHTSQRRGLDPSHPGQELIVLAMIPGESKDQKGIGAAMSELALKILAHNPHDWLSRNFTEIRIPQLGAADGPVKWMYRYWPKIIQRLLMRLTAHFSQVITAVYTDPQNVVNLINDLKNEWLTTNRQKRYPISIVLSGLFNDVHRCCQQSGLREHTYLHSLGFFGRTQGLPAKVELELITMCGHGLIAPNRGQYLVREVRQGKVTPREAAEQIARPCVCGIVNRERAEEIFRRLAEESR